MLKNDRSGRVFIDPQGDGQKERRKADNPQAGTDDIKDAFNSPIVPESQVVAETEGNDMAVDEAFRIERRQRQAAHIGDKGDFFDQGLDAIDNVLDSVVAEARCDDHDVLDPGLADDIFGIFKTAQVWHHSRYLRFWRIVLQIADEIIADARIVLKIIQDDGRRLTGSHDEDRQLEQFEMPQDMFDEVSFGYQEKERGQPQ